MQYELAYLSRTRILRALLFMEDNKILDPLGIGTNRAF